MTDFAVAHLSAPQPDVLPGGFDEGVWMVLVPLIEMRSSSKRDSVSYSIGGIAKSVENYQDKRCVLKLGQC